MQLEPEKFSENKTYEFCIFFFLRLSINLLYFSDRNGPKISFCKIKLKIFRLGFSHSAPLEQAKDKTQFFLLIFLAFVQHFFLLPYTPMKMLMEYFCQEGGIQQKKSTSSKNKDSIAVCDVRVLANLANRMQNMLVVSTQWRSYQQNNGQQTRRLARVLFSGWFPDFTD